MPEPPLGRITHQTPARIRIRIADRRRDAAFFEVVRQRLSSWDGVDRVEVNPATGSVLVHIRDGPSAFLDQQAGNELFALADRADRPGAARLDLRSLALLTFVGAGVVQLARGNVMAPAVSLFWYAGDMLGLWRDGGVNRDERT